MAEKKVISDFEAQIRQLIADHRRLTALCKETAAERDVLRKENRDLQMQVKELGKELARVQLSQGLAGNAPDQSKAIARVNRLIREVDKCITLLNKPDRIGEELSGKKARHTITTEDISFNGKQATWPSNRQ